jgi:hypothetical protein
MLCSSRTPGTRYTLTSVCVCVRLNSKGYRVLQKWRRLISTIDSIESRWLPRLTSNQIEGLGLAVRRSAVVCHCLAVIHNRPSMMEHEHHHFWGRGKQLVALQSPGRIIWTARTP